MITIKDVIIPTLEGQYWAWLNPLSLLRVTQGGDVPNFIMWQCGLEAEETLSIVGPLNSNFCILRFSYAYSDEEISRDLATKFRAKTGDVFELRNKMLAFTVVENGGVTLYTDERIPYFSGGVIDSLVQRGPGPDPKKMVPTRYRRILNAHNPNLPLVRPLDRVLLRPEENGPVLLPYSNVRSKDRVFSNLKADY